MKTEQGDRIIIFLIPSVSPKGEEECVFLLIQAQKYFACICKAKLICCKLAIM